MSDAFDSRDAFVARFGGVFEHSPWIAVAAWEAGLPADARTADGLHAALVTQFRASSRERRLEVLLAHPDLAGRLAIRGELTADSTAEQASAGLDKCGRVLKLSSVKRPEANSS